MGHSTLQLAVAVETALDRARSNANAPTSEYESNLNNLVQQLEAAVRQAESEGADEGGEEQETLIDDEQWEKEVDEYANLHD